MGSTVVYRGMCLHMGSTVASTTGRISETAKAWKLGNQVVLQEV